MSYTPVHRNTHHQSSSWLGQKLLHLAKLPYPLLLMTLVFMPLFYYHGQTWWLPLLLIILTVIYIFWALPVWWHGHILPAPRCPLALLLLAVPFAVCCLQLVPDLPALETLAPKVAETWRDFNHIAVTPATPTLSLAPDYTLERALMFLTCTMFLFLLVNCVHSPGALKGLLLAVSCAALGNALLAYVSLGASPQQHQAEGITGAFLNRNHFAFLMLLGTVTTLTLLTIITHSSKHADDSFSAQAWEKMTVPLVLIIFILLTAQVISLSRGAFLASTIAIILFAILWLTSPHRNHRKKRQVLIAYGVILAMSLAFALHFTIQKLSQRYQELTKQDFTLDDRWLIWKDSLTLIRNYWQTGVGQGAFPFTIQSVESGHFTRSLVGHAHNDFLEFTAETGVPISALLGMLSLALFIYAMKKAWKCQDYTSKWTAMGALVAMVGAMSHELVEFNLQAWANMLVFTAIMAIATCATINRKEKPEADKKKTSWHQHRRKRYTTRLPWLLTAVCATAALPLEVDFLGKSLKRAEFMNDMAQGLHTGKPANVDFQRRMNLAEEGRHPLLNDHYLLRQRAIIHATYAETDQSMAPELLKQAATDIAEAAKRLPLDGHTAFLNATFQQHAVTFALNDVTEPQLETLYDWAVQCQPFMLPTLEKIAMREFQAFLDANAQDDPKVLEHHQKRTQKILQQCLNLDPENKEAYDALFYLYGDTPQLIEKAPENYDSMSTLANVLIQRRLPKDALALAKHILKQREKLKLNDHQIIETLSIMAATQAILGLQKEREETWNELWNTIRRNNYLEDGKRHGGKEDTVQETDYKRRLAHIDKQLQTYFLSNRLILEKAQLLASLGKQVEAVITLEALAYHLHVPPTGQEIDQALNMIGNPHTLPNAYFITRGIFLTQALAIVKAEQTGNTANIHAVITQLLKLERQQETADRPWMNRHLIPIFTARAWILIDQPDKAAEELRKALNLCHNNIIALRLMQQIKPEKLRLHEQNLLLLLGKPKCPITYFQSGLVWLANSFQEPDIKAKHQKQTVIYFFSCYKDITRTINMDFTYQDQQGPVFKDRITFEDGQEMTFRIGELIPVKKTWQPFTKTLSYATRIIANGPLAIYAEQQQAMPAPYARAFNINLKEN